MATVPLIVIIASLAFLADEFASTLNTTETTGTLVNAVPCVSLEITVGLLWFEVQLEC